MQRAQLFFAIASATRQFVPAVSPAAPVAPALETVVQPAGAALSSEQLAMQRVALVQPRAASPWSGVGVETVAAFALAGVAAASFASLRSGRPSMEADEEKEMTAEEKKELEESLKEMNAALTAELTKQGLLSDDESKPKTKKELKQMEDEAKKADAKEMEALKAKLDAEDAEYESYKAEFDQMKKEMEQEKK
jgi:hypothetical protein